MDRLLIRTKLQAVIARQMIADGLIRDGVHLVLVEHQANDESRADLMHQAVSFGSTARRTTRLSRARAGAIGTTLYFAWLLAIASLRGERVYAANLNWFPLGMALKLVPWARIHTLDDGAGNLSTFHSEQPSLRGGVGGRLSRRLFPRGVARFVRGRIVRHATIFPGLPNVVAEDRVDAVRIDWSTLMSPEDSVALPKGVRRVFLGSVYAELQHDRGRDIRPDQLKALEAWADLYIPHPRQSQASGRSHAMVHYPAECFIAHYAQSGPLLVAHFSTSAALSFRGDDRITWVDLMATDISTFLEQQRRSE